MCKNPARHECGRERLIATTVPQLKGEMDGRCRVCPMTHTVIFRLVKAKTISMPKSRNCLRLGHRGCSNSLQPYRAVESRSAHSTSNGRTDETAAPRQVIAPVPAPQNGLASPAR